MAELAYRMSNAFSQSVVGRTLRARIRALVSAQRTADVSSVRTARRETVLRAAEARYSARYESAEVGS